MILKWANQGENAFYSAISGKKKTAGLPASFDLSCMSSEAHFYFIISGLFIKFIRREHSCIGLPVCLHFNISSGISPQLPVLINNFAVQFLRFFRLTLV
jgi:hypothetical protein